LVGNEQLSAYIARLATDNFNRESDNTAGSSTKYNSNGDAAASRWMRLSRSLMR